MINVVLKCFLFQQYHQLLETVFGFLNKPVSANESHRKVESFTSQHGIKLNPVKEMIKTILIIVKGKIFYDLRNNYFS